MARLPKHVNGFIDRHGKARHYVRVPGQKSVRLPGLPWSPEFMTTYARVMGAAEPVRREPEIGASRTAEGTVNAVIVAYFQSEVFKRLATETQRSRRGILERFRECHGEKRVYRTKSD